VTNRSRPGRAVATALAFAIACSAPLSCALAQPTGAAGRGSRADEVAARLADLRSRLRPRPGGVLGLMGYNATPDGSTNAVQVNRGTQVGGGEGDPELTLGQFGVGFTVSESFPLFLEGYLGYARYDPRALFTGGEEARRVPLRWNNVAATAGVGYDIRLAEYLYLRPVLNASLGYAASDAALFGAFLQYRTGADVSPLTDSHVNVWGLGGSLTLAYYDYRPARDIDVELRYTQLHLQTFGDTLPAARGDSIARTLGLWTRLRWPTGREAFGRPIRWVIDGSASYYLGDQRDALGFAWSAKVGGGIEFDVGRYEVGALGINLTRVRLIGRYFFGDKNVTGTSFGIGISF
jgi:hypothetical protein